MDQIHRVDRHVGGRIRARRRELGISQESLAARIGTSFQQIQKYERAANRVSASKLYEISQTLSCSPGWFFEELTESADAPEQHDASGAAGVSLGGGAAEEGVVVHAS